MPVNYRVTFFKFIQSTDFAKACILSFSVAAAITLCNLLDFPQVAPLLALGCLLSSPGDTTGTFKHKIAGILTAILLAAGSSVIAGYAELNTYLVYPVIAILIFGISYLSLYGFRASLVAFSGLLAVVLSFANIASVIPVWQRGLIIALGGIWYLILSSVWFFLNPKRPVEQLLNECMELTGSFLKTRARIALEGKERKALQEKLTLLQTKLNDKHESLREILINSRKSFGRSNYYGKCLLIFIELVDILELAMANPVDYSQMDKLFKEQQIDIGHFSALSKNMGNQLQAIAKAREGKSKLPPNFIPEYLKKANNELLAYRESIDIGQNRENMLMLRNLFEYQKDQAQKINNLLRILNDLEANTRLFAKQKEMKGFITTQDYSPKKLVEHFAFSSTFFKHSLRLSLVVLVGFFIGSIFSIQNAYWILLTIIVIMRPNYGLTKKRTKERIIGTLIGGTIAVGIVFLTQNKTLYAILALVSLTTAFSMLQKNYKTAATFITLCIVFVYALLKPDVLGVIQFRVIDTLVGAGLAALGNFLLWPAWEAHAIGGVILNTLKANRNYLNEVGLFYEHKNQQSISYRLARKHAFLEMGNLSLAFQRMAQEPKSKQKNLELLYEIMVLNQTFLSALASLGTYIKKHKTTKASEDFKSFVEQIAKRLENSEKKLLANNNSEEISSEKIEKVTHGLEDQYRNLVEERTRQIASGNEKIALSFRSKLQEAHLVNSQLNWLLNISINLEKAISENKLVKYE